MQGFISDYVKISVGLAYGTGTVAREGATLDMQGWDGVLAIVQFDAIEAGGTNSIKMQQGALANATDMADLTGTSQSIADDYDSKVAYIDLYQPRERYVRLYVSKDGAKACAETVTYIQYKGQFNPASAQGTGVAGEQHASPAEGTA